MHLLQIPHAHAPCSTGHAHPAMAMQQPIMRTSGPVPRVRAPGPPPLPCTTNARALTAAGPSACTSAYCHSGPLPVPASSSRHRGCRRRQLNAPMRCSPGEVAGRGGDPEEGEAGGDGSGAAGAGEGAQAGGGAGDRGGDATRASLEKLFCAADVAEPSSFEPSLGQCWAQPRLDWSRYNLQLLFVDSIFERIAEWNGWSRALVPWACGLHAGSVDDSAGAESGGGTDADDVGSTKSMSKRAAIFQTSSELELFTGSLAKPADKFAQEDLDFYDLLLVLDSGLYQEILSRVPPEHAEHYKRKVLLLTCFSDYESEGIVLATGGLALLPRKLSLVLRQGFAESKRVVDVPSPDLTSATSEEELGTVVRTLILACGGLCKFLMDSFPEAQAGQGPHR